MKNEARFFEKIDKVIKKMIITMIISIIVGIISIVTAFNVEVKQEIAFVNALNFAISISFVLVLPALMSFFISEHLHCKKILKQIFAKFPINQECMININKNIPEKFDLEGKVLSTLLLRGVNAKVKLYCPQNEEMIGIMVEIEGYEHFRHTINIFTEESLLELKKFLIED